MPWGNDSKPLACRQRQFPDGYIPVVSDAWTDGPIRYDNEMIKGQYTCHNHWSLITQRSAIRLARFLGEAMDISTLTVIPLHKDNRACRFVVRTSMDGSNRTVHIDKRDNKEAFGARGYGEKFQLTPMRDVRIEMFGNTLNEGNHLVELIAN